MRIYKLTPINGWKGFPKNKEVGDILYSTFMPIVNEGAWSYMNYTTGTGMFEDDRGNSVFIEFQEGGEELQSLCVSIKISDSGEIGMIESTMIDLETKYSLVNIPTDNN